MEVRWSPLCSWSELNASQFCTSGDLGTMIRKAQRAGQPLNEDRIWNIFLQITLALHHCHWPAERPSANGRQSGRASAAGIADNAPRYQVLHRDLKPENSELWISALAVL